MPLQRYKIFKLAPLRIFPYYFHEKNNKKGRPEQSGTAFGIWFKV
jgi:hypothetical protein